MNGMNRAEVLPGAPAAIAMLEKAATRSALRTACAV